MFKIGDRVKIKDCYSKSHNGKKGTVAYVYADDCYAVCFCDGEVAKKIHGSYLVLTTDTQPTHERPPLGLEPKKIWVDRRYSDVVEAILRYIDKSMPIPLEWVEEYNELASKGEIK